MKRGREVQNITDQYVKHYRIFFLAVIQWGVWESRQLL